MVMRYRPPAGTASADAMRRLEVFNAAKEIAEVEKEKARGSVQIPETPHTKSPTLPENPANFSVEKPKVSRIKSSRGADRIRTDA